MKRSEAAALLSALGLSVGSAQVEEVVAKTEGWPVAIYLAGLALRDGTDPARALAEFAGDDVVVAEYLQDEFTSRVTTEQLSFLRRISILDRFSGELCDAVLEGSGSEALLKELAGSHLLISPLDRKGDWFRFHSLLGRALQKELRRAEPELERDLHRRAGAWFGEHGDPDRAVEHTITAGDVERAGDLILNEPIPEYAARGRNATVISWLSRFTEKQVESCAPLALAAFHSSLAGGQGLPRRGLAEGCGQGRWWIAGRSRGGAV